MQTQELAQVVTSVIEMMIMETPKLRLIQMLIVPLTPMNKIATKTSEMMTGMKEEDFMTKIIDSTRIEEASAMIDMDTGEKIGVDQLIVTIDPIIGEKIGVDMVTSMEDVLIDMDTGDGILVEEETAMIDLEIGGPIGVDQENAMTLMASGE